MEDWTVSALAMILVCNAFGGGGKTISKNTSGMNTTRFVGYMDRDDVDQVTEGVGDVAAPVFRISQVCGADSGVTNFARHNAAAHRRLRFISRRKQLPIDDDDYDDDDDDDDVTFYKPSKNENYDDDDDDDDDVLDELGDLLELTKDLGKSGGGGGGKSGGGGGGGCCCCGKNLVNNNNNGGGCCCGSTVNNNNN